MATYRRRHIFRTLHAAFDLQRGHTHFGELGDAVRQGQILQGERIGFAALGLEGQTAGLGTESPVGRCVRRSSN